MYRFALAVRDHASFRLSWSAFPRLALLKFPGIVQAVTEAPIPTQLRKVHINGLAALVYLSRQPAFHSIHRLVLTVPTLQFINITPLALPHLRELELLPTYVTTQEYIVLAQSLVCAAPSLSRLCITSYRHVVLTRVGRYHLARFLCLLQERRLDEVEFGGNLARLLPQSLAPRLKWLRLTGVLSAQPPQAREEDVVLALDAAEAGGAWTIGNR